MSSRATLPRLTSGPKRLMHQACWSRRGRLEQDALVTGDPDHGVDDLLDHGTARVVRADRPALAALRDHQPGAGGEVLADLALPLRRAPVAAPGP